MKESKEVSTNLKQVLDQLSTRNEALSIEEVARSLSLLASFKDELCQLESFDPLSYRRNRILRTEGFDLLLLCWRAGQRTPIHDHSGSICGVKVIRGQGVEVTFEPSKCGLIVPASNKHLATGDLTVSIDRDIHLVANVNNANEDLVTLHLYSPPLQKMRVYSQEETILANYCEVTERAAASGCWPAVAQPRITGQKTICVKSESAKI